MKIKEKLLLDFHGLMEHGPINIVVLGDSVSHGAVIDNIDYENAYWNLLKKKLNQFRDYVPVNMINASIGGTTAKNALPRLERQVLKHEPDLIIVCFGLNDVNGSLTDYTESLREIFAKCMGCGFDVIFLTPNMLNTYVADDTPVQHTAYARITAQMQNEGRMDEFIFAAIDLARSMNVPVCDCYSKWKELSKTQDVTMLLANRINHPTAQMHQLFADCLYELIIGDIRAECLNNNTMFNE